MSEITGLRITFGYVCGFWKLTHHKSDMNYYIEYPLEF